MAGNAPLAFVDVETTGVDPDVHEIWEIAICRVSDDGEDWFAKQIVCDLESSSSDALRISGYYDRFDVSEAVDPYAIANSVAVLTAGCHLVGMSVSFDAAFLTRLLRSQHYGPAWHYHLVDVEAMIAGKYGVRPPWKSDDLTKLLGMSAEDFSRHTAAGDVEWTRALYEALVDGS